MREIISEISDWLKAGEGAALATVVRLEGSSPRPLGSKMAISGTGQVRGSVSGGCIEAEIIMHSKKVIETGQPMLMHFSTTGDENPFETGLDCGGEMDVLLESMANEDWKAIFDDLEHSILQKEPVVLVTVISGQGLGWKMLVWRDGKHAGYLGEPALDASAIDFAQESMQLRRSGHLKIGDQEVFAEVILPPDRLIVIGAVHIAQLLLEMADILGLATVLIDPRRGFADPGRFPRAGKLIVDWPANVLAQLEPDANTAIVALSHNDAIDEPALVVALNSRAGYIGVLGSKGRIPGRNARLRQAGVSDEQLARLRTPVGIQIGANSPQEIAISILADIIKEKNKHIP